MPAKKQIQPGERVPLKLTAAERKLILELLLLEPHYEEMILNTPSRKPVMMTLDDLEDFGGYIAAEANHSDDPKKEKKLDAIFDKILLLQDTHTDEESPPTIKIASGQKSKPQTKVSENKKAQRKPKVNLSVLYQFKITLLGSKPLIWRRIHVQDCTLDDLHELIQTAMGWTNSHLHQFDFKGKRYGDPELLNDGCEDFECEDSTSTILSEILPKTGKRFAFKYEYDFGDGWEHEVLFEGKPKIDPKAKYPLCLEGERACPPEDIGGIWGYAEYLEALVDSKHERHEEYMEWSGSFAPETFDPKQATKEMKKGLPDWRSM